MDKIKIEISYQELTAFLLVFECFEWRQSLTPEMKSMKVLVTEIYYKLYAREPTLRTGKKKVKINLKYYQAFALQKFGAYVMDFLTPDSFEKNTAHRIQYEIHKQL